MRYRNGCYEMNSDDDDDDFDVTEEKTCPECGADAYWTGSNYECDECGWCGH